MPFVECQRVPFGSVTPQKSAARRSASAATQYRNPAVPGWYSRAAGALPVMLSGSGVVASFGTGRAVGCRAEVGAPGSSSQARIVGVVAAVRLARAMRDSRVEEG